MKLFDFGVKQTNKRGREWKTISLLSDYTIYCLENKKEEEKKRERKKKESAFCSVEHTNVPLGSLAGLVGSGFATKCEFSLLETKCSLWWQLLPWWESILEEQRRYIKVALWAVDCFSQAWLITPSSWQTV